MAFSYFDSMSIDLAVIEVGLGGRLDATNVVDPLVSVITPIGLDHIAALGNTVQQIAREKAGIIKPNRPVVVAPQPSDALGELQDVAARAGSQVHQVPTQIGYDALGFEGGREVCRLEVRGRPVIEARLRMPGVHQVVNAATAACAVSILCHAGYPVSDEALSTGLESAIAFGRCQIFREGSRTIVLDTAHTVESAQALSSTIREALATDHVSFVVAMSSDKSFEAFADTLAPLADEVIVTRFMANPRAAGTEALAQAWGRTGVPVRSAISVAEAVAEARSSTICITGSTFLVGDALSTVFPRARAELCQGIGL